MSFNFGENSNNFLLPDGSIATTYYLDQLVTNEDATVMVIKANFFAAQKGLVGSVR